MKRGILISLSIVLVLLLVACPPKPAPPPLPALPAEIKIGGVFDLTGGLAGVGGLIRDGAALAVKEINALGGIAGRPIKFIVEDGATDPAKGFEAVKKLVEIDGVKVIIGPMISGAVMASGAYVKEKKVLLVSPSATSPLITLQPWTDFVYRTTPDDALQGRVLANLILERGYKRPAIMVMDNPYGVGIETVVKEVLKGKVDIVASIRYDPKKLDYLTELGVVKGAKPDVVLHVGYHDDGIVVYKQALGLGLDVIPWLAAEGVYAEAMFKDPAAAEFMKRTVQGTAVIAPLGIPTPEIFRKAFVAEYKKDPGVYSDTAYDAVKMVALAISFAGVYDGEKIRDTLFQIGKSYLGASGYKAFNEKGDQISGTYEIWKVELIAGKYKFTRVAVVTLP